MLRSLVLFAAMAAPLAPGAAEARGGHTNRESEALG